MADDPKIDEEAMAALEGATELREGRREMKAGQYLNTPYGQVRFALSVDMPGRVSEDDFKKYMVQYGEIIQEAFSHA